MIRTILMASTVLALPLAACAQNDMAEPSTASSTTTSAPASDAMATGSTDAMATGSADAMATTNSGMASDGSMATGASATTSLTPGATVYDTAGGVVGTVSAINGANVVLNTGSKHRQHRQHLVRHRREGPDAGDYQGTTRRPGDCSRRHNRAPRSIRCLPPAPPSTGWAARRSVRSSRSKVNSWTVTTTKGDVRLPKTGFRGTRTMA